MTQIIQSWHVKRLNVGKTNVAAITHHEDRFRLKFIDVHHNAFLQLLIVHTRQEGPSNVEAQEEHLLLHKCCHCPARVQTVAQLHVCFPCSGSRSSKTFKPKKNIPEGSHQYELLKHAEATLGSGNLRQAVMLPEGEDLNEWIAVNSKWMNTTLLFMKTISQGTNYFCKCLNINDPCTEVEHLLHQVVKKK